MLLRLPHLLPIQSRPFMLPGRALSRRWAPGVMSTLLLTFANTSCKPSAADVLGPAPAFVVLELKEPGGVAEKSRGVGGMAGKVTGALTDGFAAELIRTVFVTQQYIANVNVNGIRAGERARTWAAEAVPVVLGVPEASEPRRGLIVDGNWLGGPVERPDSVWVPLPGDLDDRVVATLAARLGRYLGEAAATAGTFAGSAGLAEAYQLAIEVIGREWRAGAGRRAAAPPKNDPTSAETFAGIRENRFVRAADRTVRPAKDLLQDPLVAATVIYRLSQDKKLSKKVAPEAFYAPLINDRVPPGISPAAVLGSFRNMQMKLLGAWVQATLSGHPPAHIGELVEAYAQAFPDEREEVLRLFLVTTLGGTVVRGGVAEPDRPDLAVAALNDLLADVIAGEKTLAAAASPE